MLRVSVTKTVKNSIWNMTQHRVSGTWHSIEFCGHDRVQHTPLKVTRGFLELDFYLTLSMKVTDSGYRINGSSILSGLSLSTLKCTPLRMALYKTFFPAVAKLKSCVPLKESSVSVLLSDLNWLGVWNKSGKGTSTGPASKKERKKDREKREKDRS